MHMHSNHRAHVYARIPTSMTQMTYLLCIYYCMYIRLMSVYIYIYV